MAQSYKQLLIQLGFNPQELEMFIKEQNNFSTKAQQIGDFNNKHFGHNTRPTVYNYKSLYNYVTSSKGATPDKPLTRETTRRIIREIERTQKEYEKTFDEEGLSPQASQLLHEAVYAYNKYANALGYLQVDENTAVFRAIANFDGNMDELHNHIDEALTLLFRYDEVPEQRAPYVYAQGQDFYLGINMLYSVFSS